jgi:hypothetical protein
MGHRRISLYLQSREFGAADAGNRGTDRAGLIDILLPGTVTVFIADGSSQNAR